jgi:hypothetical protein
VNVALETSASPSSKESCSKSRTGVSLASPTPRPDSTTRATSHPQPSFKEARWDSKSVAQPDSWQSPGSPIIPPSPLALDLVYGLWYTDAEESRFALPLESCLDGDIFGVGKRPVQHEIEKDGCIRLVFVEE